MSQPTEPISGNQYRVAHIYTDKGNPHLKGDEFSGWLAVDGRTIGMTGGIRPRSYLHTIGTSLPAYLVLVTAHIAGDYANPWHDVIDDRAGTIRYWGDAKHSDREKLCDGGTWTNKKGETCALRLQDILIVAPYNAQVSALLERLPAGSRVGTVDKFQGQEAPVVLYSMATSTPDDAPRGMEFLYSLNRLNVAVSRAQCVAVIVASPALFQVRCKTPRQIELANAFCRYLEMACPV